MKTNYNYLVGLDYDADNVKNSIINFDEYKKNSKNKDIEAYYFQGDIRKLFFPKPLCLIDPMILLCLIICICLFLYIIGYKLSKSDNK